ncbi:hypothetical protein T265_15856, partial [Opisthorchis viverrini]
WISALQVACAYIRRASTRLEKYLSPLPTHGLRIYSVMAFAYTGRCSTRLGNHLSLKSTNVWNELT